MSRPSPKSPPKPHRLRENVRALSDADLAKLVNELAFSTKLEQAVLAMARQETKRRTKRQDHATP